MTSLKTRLSLPAINKPSNRHHFWAHFYAITHYVIFLFKSQLQAKQFARLGISGLFSQKNALVLGANLRSILAVRAR